jgi:hypothetical protein
MTLPDVTAVGESEEAALLARLSRQFGDLDVNGIIAGQGTSCIDNFLYEDGNNHDGAHDDKNEISSEDSSLAEPSPEELAAWQVAQFQKGQQIVQKRKEEQIDPIQIRRLALRGKSDSNGDGIDDDEWEEISALPDLQGQSSIFFRNNHISDHDLGLPPLLHKLATSPEGDPEILGTKWQRLYSSLDGDGLSFWNCWYELNGYDGPTLILMNVIPSRNKTIKTTKTSTNNNTTTATIGFFTTSTWQQESIEFHGNQSAHDNAFLFAMDENENRVEFFGMNEKAKSKKAKYMYCNPTTSSAQRTNYSSLNHNQRKNLNDGNKTDGDFHGICIGSPRQPRLHLTETLEDCRCMSYDPSRTFRDGDLFLTKTAFQDSLYYFDVEAIEIWGCGGTAWCEHALRERDKIRGIASSHLQRRRQILDKAQFLDDFRNGVHSIITKSNASGSYFDHVVHAVDRCDV